MDNLLSVIDFVLDNYPVIIWTSIVEHQRSKYILCIYIIKNIDVLQR